MKKKILIVTLSDLRYDARVRRQVQALKDSYQITLSGFNGVFSEDYVLVPLMPTRLTLLRKLITAVLLMMRAYRLAHRVLHDYLPFLRNQLSGQSFDLIIANDVETLPLAFALPGHHRVLFDAHEYAPRHFEDKLMWRLFFQPFNVWLCRKYLPLTKAMTTVGAGLAKEYKKNFNVDPVVIPNATNYFDLKPVPVEDNKIRLVYMGIVNPSRRLELMMEMMDLLDDRFVLDLFLLTPGFASDKTKKYIDSLQQYSERNPRIRLFPPIKSVDVVKTINHYDIGVFLLPPINFNYENTLPNKLFDYIQARLGIAIGPTPEMAQIVNAYHNGVVSQDFTPQSLAEKLNPLTKAQIQNFKLNSEKAAIEFNAEKSAVILQELAHKAINA
ncbi:MAG: capsular biosynthesis protein [Bacteroidota bacterium]